jgi:hypothetical protein
MNGYAVSIVAKRQNRGENQLFELADGFGLHLANSVRNIGEQVKGK